MQPSCMHCFLFLHPKKQNIYIKARINSFIMKKIFLFTLLGTFALGACHNAQDAHDMHAEEETENHETAEAHSDEIILPKAKAEASGVKSAIIEPGSFQQVIRTSGQLLAAQGDESTAVALVAGIVSLKPNILEGTYVSKGTPLVTLSSDNIAEGDPVQRAKVNYLVAKKEYERMRALLDSKLVSEKEFAQARQNYENARISYEALAANHTERGQNIPSPLTGYVKSILVKEGDYVAVGQPLVSVTQNKRLYLRAEVSEKYYAQLPAVISANFQTPYNNQTYKLSELNGKMRSYGKSSGNGSFYIPVTFEFDNKGDITPGTYVDVFLLSSPIENALCVPRTALTEEEGTYFVYVQLDEEGYRKQEVTVGNDNGEKVQILSGIKAGDRVVVEGAYQVRLASASNAIPAHSHEH